MVPIKILISDSDLLYAELLQALLEDHDEFDLVGISHNYEQTISIVKEKKVDVSIQIYCGDEEGTFSEKSLISQIQPDTKFIIIGAPAKKKFLMRCVSNKINSYVTKNIDVDELVQAIRMASTGGSYLCRSCLMALMGAKNITPSNTPFAEPLTRREKEVLHLIIVGYLNQEIANELCISIRTVETHRRNILLKYGENSFLTVVKHILVENEINIFDLI